MQIGRHLRSNAKPSLAFVLLTILLGVLWLAGGASRADALGQAVVRAAAWAVLIVGIISGLRPGLRAAWPVAALLAACVVLVALQLIPLPPGIWQSLPGRAAFSQAAAAAGEAQPFRPLAIVPSAATNALFSLVVPISVLFLATSVKVSERRWLVPLMLGLVVISMLSGLLQLSGSGVDNPFVNNVPGLVSGPFANRNHFAVFLAIGCVLVSVWAFLSGEGARWRAVSATPLLFLLFLGVLATGSRAGTGIGVLAIVLSGFLVRRGLVRELGKAPRWVAITLVIGLVATAGGVLWVSVVGGRAESIQRLFALDPGQDMRRRALPTVIGLVQTYLPLGAGAGSFDALFRMQEPFSLLKYTYFNHAHDDFLEVLLDTGLPGGALLLSALAWWSWASLGVWRVELGAGSMMPRAGSVILLLVFLASIFDYPARTPLFMAIIVLAALWLSWGADRREPLVRPS